ncbi:ABATE domain-containing protein [Actinoallomurus purpureus]|uniref:CGNR zinc finger domain-containing protein n=1 Tax=Actinoallomurus purpureus TaxID=478114 RepID=UPI002092FEA2|nr:CGNR zinc finger domain-containing protein [Actinoallomurus purpureus]MCO6006131.1 ABATE domain-containing protein [Actinoallomurus purpureus]
MLTSASSLDSWFRESGMVDGDTGSRPSDVPKAVALREAIHSLIATRLANEGYDESSLSLVNETARTPCTIPQLTAVGRRIDATPEQAMSSVARAAIDILSGPDAQLLKECGRPECTQVYIDRSRGARRDWCSTKCRHRVNAAAYRARKREDHSRPVTTRP